MTITPKVWNFPTIPISKQLFHVPGAMVEGGYTRGGARIGGFEPGGFGVMKVQPSMQVREWDYPFASWLMSKTSGQILRFRMAPTPQVATAASYRGTGVEWDNDGPWSNLSNWEGDVPATFGAASTEGSTTARIALGSLGQLLKPGHVIGHAFDTYLVDEVDYAVDDTYVDISVTPPIRRPIAADDVANFRPYFTGMVANSGDIIQTYDAELNGMIEIPMITLSEVII